MKQNFYTKYLWRVWHLFSKQETFILFKPDAAAHQKQMNDVLAMISGLGLHVGELKKSFFKEEHVKVFYKNVYDRVISHRFDHEVWKNEIVAYMISGPCFWVTVTGRNALRKLRKFNGATNPAKAKEGTIRNYLMAFYGATMQKNKTHTPENLLEKYVQLQVLNRSRVSKGLVIST